MSIKDNRSGMYIFNSITLLRWRGRNRVNRRTQSWRPSAPAFQIAEATWTHAIQDANTATSVETKLKVRLAQLRLTLPQEMTEQLTALRRSSGDRPHPDHGDDRERTRSRPRSRDHPPNFAVPLEFRTGCRAYHPARRNNREMAASR